jgi:hypothetical protein
VTRRPPPLVPLTLLVIAFGYLAVAFIILN